MTEIYGQRVQTTVKQEYLPYVVDTVLNSNVFFQRMVRSAKEWKGRALRVPVKVGKNSTGTSFRGFDTFSVAATNNRQFFEFTPSFYQITVALPGDELSVAEATSEDEIINLMKVEIQSSTEDMADDLGTIFYADGTGNGGKDPAGLGLIVDDGTTSATYGGLTRATYDPYLDSTVTASSGMLTLAKVDTLNAAASSGSQVPTVTMTTETVFNLYGQLLRPQERITKPASRFKGGLFGTTGFDSLEYNGKPILKDEKCTSGAFIQINENFIDWYALPFAKSKPISYKSQIKGNDYDAPLGLGFSWTDWIIPANSGSVVGHIYFGGQLVTSNPKRHAKLTGITQI